MGGTGWRSVRFSCCCFFFGLLRPGELVRGGISSHTLGRADVRVSGDELVITVPSSKTSNQPATITLQARRSFAWCPVRAVSGFLAVRGSAPGPFFTDVFGVPITSSRLTSVMKRPARLSGVGTRASLDTACGSAGLPMAL